MEQVARCLCGDTSVTVTGDPLLTSLCGCDDCQVRAGASYRWLVWFAQDQVKTRGGFHSHVHQPPQGHEETSYRCARCGTPMWARQTVGMPGTIAVNAAAFTPEHRPPPELVSFGDHLADWVVLPDGMETGETH